MQGGCSIITSEWDAEAAKEERRQRYSDIDEVLTWSKLSQENIDNRWTEWTREMGGEISKKVRIKKKKKKNSE